jgi:hypothetical protein
MLHFKTVAPWLPCNFLLGGDMTADEMFELARDGNGRIVSSGDLCVEAISEAQACKRFYVDEDGFGFAYLPWELTTDKDREREKSFSETNGRELVALRAMQDGIAEIMGSETSISVALAYLKEWKKVYDDSKTSST